MKKGKASKTTRVARFRQPVGRPPKWTSVKQLTKLIEDYFSSCWEPVMDRILTPEAQEIKQADPRKHHDFTEDDYVWVQRTDWKGDPLFKRVRPYSVTGLALALGTNRETLRDYGKKANFSDTVERAKTIIQNYVEEGMLLGEIAPIAGSFNLKNNFGWTDKIEHTGEGGGPIYHKYSELSDYELQNIAEGSEKRASA